MTKKHLLKQAFTLTELLIVVIVLGVLAAVAVPKFSRVLETRRTTEAEHVLFSLRTEQEHRCVLGKHYQTNPAAMEGLASAKGSKNYSYTLTEVGANATSSKGYSIQMPSYKNGVLCCEGSYCSSLSKSYPSCSSLSVPEDECAGGSSAPPCGDCSCAEYARNHPCECANECSCEEDPHQEKCQNCANSTYAAAHRCECDAGYAAANPCECSPNTCACTSYAEANPCVCAPNTCACPSYAAAHPCECDDGYAAANPCECQGECVQPCDEASKPVSVENCGNCGRRTRTVTCNTATGRWEEGNWGECGGQGVCAAGATQTRDCTLQRPEFAYKFCPVGNQVRTCSGSCQWGAWQGKCTARLKPCYMHGKEHGASPRLYQEGYVVVDNPNMEGVVCRGGGDVAYHDLGNIGPRGERMVFGPFICTCSCDYPDEF